MSSQPRATVPTVRTEPERGEARRFRAPIGAVGAAVYRSDTDGNALAETVAVSEPTEAVAH